MAVATTLAVAWLAVAGTALPVEQLWQDFGSIGGTFGVPPDDASAAPPRAASADEAQLPVPEMKTQLTKLKRQVKDDAVQYATAIDHLEKLQADNVRLKQETEELSKAGAELKASMMSTGSAQSLQEMAKLKEREAEVTKKMEIMQKEAVSAQAVPGRGVGVKNQKRDMLAKVSGEKKALQAAVKGLESRRDELRQAIQKVDEEADGNRRNADQKQAQLDSSIAQAQQTNAELQKAYNQAITAHRSAVDSKEKIEKALNKLTQETEQLKAVTARNRAEESELVTEHNAMKKAFRTVSGIVNPAHPAP